MKLNPDRSIALVLVQILFRLKGYRKFGFNKQDSLDMIKVEVDTSPTGKTKVFHVVNISKGTHSDDIPGIIRWHGAWRGYVYECEPSFYDAKCLRQIADFIDTANKEHRSK